MRLTFQKKFVFRYQVQRTRDTTLKAEARPKRNVREQGQVKETGSRKAKGISQPHKILTRS